MLRKNILSKGKTREDALKVASEVTLKHLNTLNFSMKELSVESYSTPGNPAIKLHSGLSNFWKLYAMPEIQANVQNSQKTA